MKKYFGSIYSLIEKLKQIRFKELLVAVPPELKVQFDQMQLKNSLYRLKLLGVLQVIYNTLNWPIFNLNVDVIGPVLFHKLSFLYFCYIFITVLFFLLTSYFSKKSNSFMLYFICYLFIILHSLLSAYSMLSTEKLLVIQHFFTGIFLYTFVPDFKPKVFISILVLWYFTLIGIIAYNSHSFVFEDHQIYTLNIFLIALVIRIFLYNGKVKAFINVFKINTLNEKLEALSITDELTKINNRRSFLNYVDMIWKQSHRLQFPINVLMIDVDYFKKYNDSRGHLEGDKALIAIAQCMKNQIKRDTDFIARFGGEEFVCLLPYIEKENAINFAKELVQNVENMKIDHPMSEHSKYVTISIGMASTIPDDHNSHTQLLDEADKALYIAKKSGRNRVVVGYGEMA